ncbi:MAG: DEAD/DEAH box helicase, partial [Paludibacteraceae bacterium]|nr:DEAD/DEAH box helicase [Paludibacteraceae bacterium]
MQKNLSGENYAPTPEYGINEILTEIRQKSQTEKEKGTDFERLMKLWFQTDPRYSNLEKVWLWEEFPARKDFGGKDLGIDLVARTEYGDYWAIQCKCYAEDATIDKAAVDSFLANASRTFSDPETLQTTEFSNLVWVQTSRKHWGANAETAIQGLSKPFNRISLHELEISTVDWKKLREGLYGEQAKLSGKQPRKHQLDAISKAHEYFMEQGHERGKLIMACGTGKTYTSLKIMEDMTDKEAFVLFLVPSIALLGQTLNAWMADKQDNMRAVCVCSDEKASRKIKDEDDEDNSVIDLAVPASTNTRTIIRQLKRYDKEHCRTVIFSTYQSIDVVKKAIDEYGREVDLIICDEAHRTTGVILKDKEESSFTKIHNNDFIRAKKRLYMTATPRLYSANLKVKAKENDNVDVLCSMDDANLFGEEFHRLTFNEAVSQGLLTDYKVLVLTVSEDDIPQDIRENIKNQYNAAADKDKIKQLQFDDATKLIGCINGLSKRIKGDNGITKQQDPLMMRRAVAFCQTINPTKSNPKFSSTQIAKYFSDVCDSYKDSITEEERKDVVNIKAKHIDGSMDANTRNELVSWLKQEADDPQECRVLCNVRCLSEGVDVPALDAVLFLSPRNSEVEVVQSVGRVMRTFKGKNYGYIIIPVIVPNDVTPEDALNDNERFKVVWTILNALRSHDENFNAHVNQINLNKQRPPKITVAGVPNGSYSIGSEDAHPANEEEAQFLQSEDVAQQLELRFGALQDGIYARLVEKVGDKMYWENWAKSVGEIAKKFIDRITLLVHENGNAHKYFEDFISGLHKNINDSIDEEQAIEMLAQHMITRPVFDALFKEYEFVNNNAVSRSMQDMLEILENEGLEMDTAVLDKFYTSVRNNVSNIDNLEGKQTIIKNLYEKFFKSAFPLTVEKLGIVYTPVECVDFIIHSVEDILKQEFNTSLTEENVHILDPFTGTGTFITRLLQSGLIRKEDMLRKYRNEIHCNEIVLLAYYIADVNIESVFHDIMHPDKYEMYDGICLTDTFQLNEHGDNDIFSQLFPENSERVLKQKKAPVMVIIGNPPYSVGQNSAND